MTAPTPDRTDGTATGTAEVSPFAAPADEGELIDIGTAAFLVRATAESTGGVLTMFEELPPLLDTPSHVHRYEDETFYVLDGEHEFVSGDRTFRLGPGGVAFLPAASRTRTAAWCPGSGGCCAPRRPPDSSASSAAWPRPPGPGNHPRPRTPGPPSSLASPGSAEHRGGGRDARLSRRRRAPGHRPRRRGRARR
jgi:quercetin dioxygenase-like cupin family protein